MGQIILSPKNQGCQEALCTIDATLDPINVRQRDMTFSGPPHRFNDLLLIIIEYDMVCLFHLCVRGRPYTAIEHRAPVYVYIVRVLRTHARAERAGYIYTCIYVARSGRTN